MKSRTQIRVFSLFSQLSKKPEDSGSKITYDQMQCKDRELKLRILIVQLAHRLALLVPDKTHVNL